MTVQTGDMTLNSHVLIVRNQSLLALVNWVMLQSFTAFSVVKIGDMWQLAHPLTVEEREEYKWLYHKMKRLNSQSDTPDDPKPPKGSGPKGGGPTGGTPAAGQVAEYQDTIAIAV